MKYKMIVFDLDGTVVTEDFKLLPGTLDAIRKIKELGLRVSVATGRMHGSALQYTSQLNLEEPAIYTNGAIYDCILEKQRKVYKSVPHEIALFVAELLQSVPVSAKFHFEDESIIKSNDTVWPSEGNQFITGKIAADLEKELTRDPLKIVFYGDHNDILKFEDQLIAKFGENLPARLFKSHFNYMELTHKEVSKGGTIQHAFKPLNIDIKECIAVGDQSNDFEMIRDAGFGIVAGQGNESLNKVKDFSIPSPGENGIELLYQFISSELA